jgi:hypothetical protein
VSASCEFEPCIALGLNLVKYNLTTGPETGVHYTRPVSRGAENRAFRDIGIFGQELIPSYQGVFSLFVGGRNAWWSSGIKVKEKPSKAFDQFCGSTLTLFDSNDSATILPSHHVRKDRVDRDINRHSIDSLQVNIKFFDVIVVSRQCLTESFILDDVRPFAEAFKLRLQDAEFRATDRWVHDIGEKLADMIWVADADTLGDWCNWRERHHIQIRIFIGSERLVVND